MPSQAERMSILEKLERGEITPQEAERLLTTPTSAPQPEKAPTRMDILEKVERGELSADQAAGMFVMDAVVEKARFDHHGKPRYDEPADEDVTFTTPSGETAGIWKAFLGLGLFITVATAALMAFIQQRSGMNFWFFCAWLPLALGIVITALAWNARNSTWLQMQVRSRKDGNRKVFFTMPLPIDTIQNFLARRSNGNVVITQARKHGKFHIDL